MQKILRKRVLRDLKKNLWRYMALALMIILGMYMVISMIAAAEDVIDGVEQREQENHMEDGEFTLFVPLNKQQIRELHEAGAEMERMFYLDFSQKGDKTIRDDSRH